MFREKYVAQAKKIAEASEETFQELLRGKLSLTQASKAIKAADAPESQPESKRLTALEIIDKLVRMIPEDLTNAVLALADEATKPVRETIRSCFILDAPGSEAETEVEAEDENADADDYTEADAEADANAIL